MDDLSIISEELIIETAHISNGYIPPPWEELTYIDANTSSFFAELERQKELRKKFNSMPPFEYHRLMKTFEKLLENVRLSRSKLLNCFSRLTSYFHSQIVEITGRARNLRTQSEDTKNNIHSTLVEVRNLRNLLEGT